MKNVTLTTVPCTTPEEITAAVANWHGHKFEDVSLLKVGYINIVITFIHNGHEMTKVYHRENFGSIMIDDTLIYQLHGDEFRRINCIADANEAGALMAETNQKFAALRQELTDAYNEAMNDLYEAENKSLDRIRDEHKIVETINAIA